jgi:uncharacterized protein with NAD-binding domain and iron-sulfur cluster
MASGLQKIAILGGGMGGLTTAFYLTSVADWKSRFEITIYQMGHRLGGKCASSRGVFDRIEEHGIHGFLGSYYNALPLMAEAYQELGRKPGQPLATFDDAFVGSNFSLMWEFRNGSFQPWASRTPANARSPKDASSYGGLKTTIGAIIDGIGGLVQANAGVIPPSLAGPLQALLASARDSLATVPLTAGPQHPIVGMIQGARAQFAAAPKAPTVPDEVRHALIVLDFLTTMVLGALADNVEVNGYDVLDEQNWSDWLHGHGIQDATLSSPVARTTVNICYQSSRGDTSLPPLMGAGAYLNWTLKSFDYLGCQLWSFAAGTGETVVAPLYQVLKARGVRFEFFHKVEALRLDPTKTSVNSVDITVQATLKDLKTPYQPLIEVKGLPSWPEWPRYEQLVQGDILKQQRIDLESYWNGWPDAAHKQLKTAKVLRAGVDYDRLVLAMFPGANHIAVELIQASNRFALGVQELPAVQTQAMQLWLRKDVAELGYPATLDPALNETAASATYYGSANGNEEFHHLIPLESWPTGSEPKAIWYFCGLMPNYEAQPAFSDTDYPKRQRERVKAQCVQYLQSCIGPIWPNATAGTLQGPGDPEALDFRLLVDYRQLPDPRNPRIKPRVALNTIGAQRFDSQFWRANIDPTELYITSPPGSTSSRMEAWGSGFKNLVLAGDWIYTGINIGSFEGATASGKLASYAISAHPPLSSIIGYPTISRPPGISGWTYPPPPHETASP